MRRRHYTEQESGLDFTAILDIAFVVMVLFFGATVYLVESGRDNPMGTEDTFIATEPLSPPIHLAIDASGLISIEGRLYERAVFMENLGRLSSERPHAPLNISVHPDANTDILAEVVKAARTLGIARVSVETGEDS